MKIGVETVKDIEVQGEKAREVHNQEDWFLLPKAHGEYVIVIRELQPSRAVKEELPLRVYKIPYISHRWYVILVTIAAVLSVIATLIKIIKSLLNKPSPEQDAQESFPE